MIELVHSEHIRKCTRVAAIFLLLVFTCLMQRNGIYGLDSNEVITFPWSLQFIDDRWLPNGWFQNTPLGSQLLTGSLVGVLVKYFGFLGASLVGRLLVYLFLAISLAVLTRYLQIPIFYVLIALFAFISEGQSIGAGEWIFGGIESKVFAYGFIFLALRYGLDKKFVLAATLFGIATSFHILVGGYGFLSYLIWSLSERANFKVWFKILCYYCLGAVVGIYNAVTEIATAWAFPDVSKLIVFFRVPHHTVPTHFSHHYEYKLIILLVGFIVLYWFIGTPESPKQLLRYAAITMITFIGGLFIASFDTNGTFLKYYLFRLGDTLFPLFIALVGYFGIKRFLSKRIIRIALPVVGSFCFIMAGTNFAVDINNFRRTDASADKWAQTCMWVKEHTAKDSLFLIPPGRKSFAVLTERATVATFNSFPFSRAYISEWYSRLMDLNGGVPPKQVGSAVKKELDENYYNLDELKILKLMQKYDASYIITKCKDLTQLDIVFSNDQFCVYKRSLEF